MNRIFRTGGVCLLLTLSTSVFAADGTPEIQSETESSVAPSGIAGSKVAELSVPPLDHIDYPRSRPQWCEQDPEFPKQGDHHVVVQSGPCDSADECDPPLDVMRRAALVAYVERLTDAFDDDWVDPNLILTASLTDPTIDQRWVARRYEGPVTVGGETKYEKVIQLRFTPLDRAEFKRMLQEVQVQRRLTFLGLIGLVGTGLLVGCSGLTNFASRRVSRRERSVPA